MNIFSGTTNRKFVGLSGTFAGGKDTAARYLEEQKGFMHVSTGDVLRAEATTRGLDHQRDTLIEIGVELRQKYASAGALVIKGLQQYEELYDNFQGGLVISGLRIIGEAQEVRNQRGTLTFIDAPVELRYERAKQRAIKEGRTVDFHTIQSLEDFIESERAELEGLGGPERPNLRGVQAISDVVLQNTGSEREFYSSIDATLRLS